MRLGNDIGTDFTHRAPETQILEIFSETAMSPYSNPYSNLLRDRDVSVITKQIEFEIIFWGDGAKIKGLAGKKENIKAIGF